MTARVRLRGDMVEFKCPGCGWTHMLNIDPDTRPCWGFNGNVELPTLTPSINAWREYGGNRETQRCHSFVTDGRIQFLGDCTHALKGQTVDLPVINPAGRARAIGRGFFPWATNRLYVKPALLTLPVTEAAFYHIPPHIQGGATHAQIQHPQSAEPEGHPSRLAPRH